MYELKSKVRGFTLMEVMVVVAILGIIATIAVPSYRRYAMEVNRKATIAEMNDIGNFMERQYTNNNGAYQAYTVATTDQPKGYTLVVALSNNNQTYTITASPDTAQSSDKCGTLTINNEGLQQAIKSGTNISGCF